MLIAPVPRVVLDCLRVFPLPDIVQFPGTVLPLHVFEPRYVAMVNDALAGDRCLAIVMLREGDHADEEQPEVFPVACAGKIVHAEEVSGGRYNILLHGIERVHLVEELAMENGYRRFRAERFRLPNDGAMEGASQQLARLQSCVMSLQESAARTDDQLLEVLRATADPIELADILGAVLVNDPLKQQHLLAEEDIGSRLESLIDDVAEVLVRGGDPPQSVEMN